MVSHTKLVDLNVNSSWNIVDSVRIELKDTIDD